MVKEIVAAFLFSHFFPFFAVQMYHACTLSLCRTYTYLIVLGKLGTLSFMGPCTSFSNNL